MIPLLPPYDTWPEWAVNLAVEIAERLGDILGDEDTPENDPVAMARTNELDFVVEVITRMANASRDEFGRPYIGRPECRCEYCLDKAESRTCKAGRGDWPGKRKGR